MGGTNSASLNSTYLLMLFDWRYSRVTYKLDIALLCYIPCDCVKLCC